MARIEEEQDLDNHSSQEKRRTNKLRTKNVGKLTRRRRARNGDADDDEDDEDEDDADDGGPMSQWKMALVVLVIVVCFATLYPTIFHPLLNSFFAKPQAPTQQQRPPIHPGMGARMGQQRPEMHPGMRAAQAQAEAAGAQTGSSRGMYTWLLPVYTVGAVCFLLYTLFKSKKKRKRRARNRYANPDSEDELFDEDDEDEEEEDAGRCGDLKSRLGKRKLRGLQDRLRQTEEAMVKILEQLEAVQKTQSPNDDVKTEPQNGEGEEAEAGEEEEELDQKPSTSGSNALVETDSCYVKDLEQALADFKELSAAYDRVKEELRAPSDQGTEEEEDVDDGSDTEQRESAKVTDHKTKKQDEHTAKKEVPATQPTVQNVDREKAGDKEETEEKAGLRRRKGRARKAN